MLLFAGSFLLFLCHSYAAINNKLPFINAITDELKTTPVLKYRPIWEDLDKRPLPEWYDRAKIGIFLHWGVFSVPSFGSEWFWCYWRANRTEFVNFMKNNYRPGFTYQDFAPQFTAEFFDPDEWAKLFADAGAKYVVLTSKHHEGFTLFPSKRSYSWNSVDIGPRRDIVKQLSDAVRKQNLKFGVYHSLYEWYNPIYQEDKKALYNTTKFVDHKVWPDLKQLVNDYNPSVIWSDGDWEAFPSYWKSTDFLAWLYNDSPVKNEIVVNDRWGIGVPCHHGDFYNCEDRYNPNTLQKHKWENAFTVDSQSWGYRRNMNLKDLMCIHGLLKEIVSTVSCGGNALINIGPTKEGTIIPVFQERLMELGTWLKVNGEAIYDSSPWSHQNDSLNGDVWYTCTKTNYDGLNPIARPKKTDEIIAVYAIILKWPPKNVLQVKDLTNYLRRGTGKLTLLGNEEKALNWVVENGTTFISLPSLSTVKSQNAWALKLSSKVTRTP